MPGTWDTPGRTPMPLQGSKEHEHLLHAHEVALRHQELEACELELECRSQELQRHQLQLQAPAMSGIGLYTVNYLIIFAEISFYPETSILLQIMMNNS